MAMEWWYVLLVFGVHFGACLAMYALGRWHERKHAVYAMVDRVCRYLRDGDAEDYQAAVMTAAYNYDNHEMLSIDQYLSKREEELTHEDERAD